jgi:crotonobetainyl-CoA:carnitine CoA-transferase CaiB-like acyl-CoA transferase
MLAGKRVMLLAGAYGDTCAELLASFGATVTNVVPAETPEPRETQWPGDLDTEGRSASRTWLARQRQISFDDEQARAGSNPPRVRERLISFDAAQRRAANATALAQRNERNFDDAHERAPNPAPRATQHEHVLNDAHELAANPTAYAPQRDREFTQARLAAQFAPLSAQRELDPGHAPRLAADPRPFAARHEHDFDDASQVAASSSFARQHARDFDDARRLEVKATSFPTQFEIDFDDSRGLATLERLLGETDLFIASAPNSWLRSHGLDPVTLGSRHPRLVFASITPFGRSGPYSEYRGGELVCSAMSGVLRLVGYPDRAPVKEALDACQFHAEAAAAAGMMIALHAREATGLGQHVDVSIQEVATSRLTNAIVLWQFDRRELARSGNQLSYGRARVRCIWQLRDGYAFHSLMSGRFGAPANAALSRWLDDCGCPNPLREVDWLAYDRSALPAETRELWENALDQFFRARTKREIANEGRRRGINAAVVQTPSDILGDPQLESRGFLRPTVQPDGSTIATPQYFVRTQSPAAVVRNDSRVAARSGDESSRAVGHAPRGALADPNLPSRGVMRPEGAATPHYFVRTESDRAAVRGSPPLASGPAPLSSALAGVNVLDLSWALVGSIATKGLADHGACVVKVESSLRPCLTRIDVQVARSTRTSLDDKPWFAQLNTSKLSLRLDLKHERAWEVLGPLLEWADVVVENFSPGTLQKLGLDYPALLRRRSRPGLIMISASAYGQTGPLAQEWGVDGTSAALSGRVSLTGWPDRPPVTPGALPYADVVVPQFMVAAVVAALIERERDGAGRYIEVAMYEIAVHQMRRALIAAQSGTPLARSGNHDPNVLHQGVYPARGHDRWVAISLFDASDWSRFTTLLGGDWPNAQTLRDIDDAARETLGRRIAQYTEQFEDFECMRRLQAAGIAAGGLQDARDLLERDPQLRAQGAFVALEHAVLGRFDHQRTPYHLSRTPAQLSAAPQLGEHGETVCRELLGLSAETYIALVRASLFV